MLPLRLTPFARPFATLLAVARSQNSHASGSVPMIITAELIARTATEPLWICRMLPTMTPATPNHVTQNCVAATVPCFIAGHSRNSALKTWA